MKKSKNYTLIGVKITQFITAIRINTIPKNFSLFHVGKRKNQPNDEGYTEYRKQPVQLTILIGLI